MAQITINSSAGDGRVFVSNATWATARGATTGTAESNNGAALATLDSNPDPDEYRIDRGFIPFDTSSIPTGSIITAATLKIYVIGKDDSQTGGEIALIQTTQASISTIASGDFDNLTLNTPDEGMARVTIASITTSAYNNFTLNATGLGWINVGSEATTLLGLRHDRDVDNSAPTPAFVGSNKNFITFQLSEDANPPQLVVTYTPPGGSFLFNVI